MGGAFSPGGRAPSQSGGHGRKQLVQREAKSPSAMMGQAVVPFPLKLQGLLFLFSLGFGWKRQNLPLLSRL